MLARVACNAVLSLDIGLDSLSRSVAVVEP